MCQNVFLSGILLQLITYLIFIQLTVGSLLIFLMNDQEDKQERLFQYRVTVNRPAPGAYMITVQGGFMW